MQNLSGRTGNPAPGPLPLPGRHKFLLILAPENPGVFILYRLGLRRHLHLYPPHFAGPGRLRLGLDRLIFNFQSRQDLLELLDFRHQFLGSHFSHGGMGGDDLGGQSEGFTGHGNYSLIKLWG
jgi:hypothetical protein